MENTADLDRITERQVEEAIISRVQDFCSEPGLPPVSRERVNCQLRDLLGADSSTKALFLNAISPTIRKHPHFAEVMSSAQLDL